MKRYRSARSLVSSACIGVPIALVMVLSSIGCRDRSDGSRSSEDGRRESPSPQRSGTSNGATNEPSDEAVASVLTLIRELPNWGRLPLTGDITAEVARIELIVERIAESDLDTIRAAMARLEEEPGAKTDSTTMHTLFVLNKFLFDLPASVTRDSPHFLIFRAGYTGISVSDEPRNPRPSDRIDCRWPWSEDDRGRWRLTERFSGFFGGPVDALKMFDFYRETFGKRELQNEPNPRSENRPPGEDR